MDPKNKITTPYAYKSSSYWISKNASYIILGINEQIPDSAIFINNTKIHSGSYAERNSIYSDEYDLIERAKDEAKRIGANVIKIINYYTYTGHTLVVKMYYLKESYLSAYKRNITSSNISNKDFCIVHVKNYCFGRYNYNITLVYNGSVVGNCIRNIGKSGVAEYPSLDLRFSQPGTFYGSNIPIEKGKEYFIHVKVNNSTRYVYLQYTTKYDF